MPGYFVTRDTEPFDCKPYILEYIDRKEKMKILEGKIMYTRSIGMTDFGGILEEYHLHMTKTAKLVHLLTNEGLNYGY